MRDRFGDINDALVEAGYCLRRPTTSPKEALRLLGMCERPPEPWLCSGPPPMRADDSAGPSPPEPPPPEPPPPRFVRCLNRRDAGKLSDGRGDRTGVTGRQRTATFHDTPTLAKALGGCRKGNNLWMARCPCHDDREPSLAIRKGRNGQTLVRCHAGCKQEDVLAELRRLGIRLNQEPSLKRSAPSAPSVLLRCRRPSH